MNLKELNDYTTALIAAGVDPALPVTALVDGWPREICDAAGLQGQFHGDPSPKLSSFRIGNGQMLALVPIGEDTAQVLNPREDSGQITHTQVELPIEPPYR